MTLPRLSKLELRIMQNPMETRRSLDPRSPGNVSPPQAPGVHDDSNHHLQAGRQGRRRADP